MNVTTHRKNWVEIYDQGTVCDVCLSVHAALCGASDPLSEDQYRVAAKMLEDRLNNWGQSPRSSAGFDNAVKALVEATLDELANGGYVYPLGPYLERCQSCGSSYTEIWHAPNDQWNRIIDPNGSGFMCPRCYGHACVVANETAVVNIIGHVRTNR